MAYHYYVYRKGGYMGEHFSKRKDAIAYCRQRYLYEGYRIEATWNSRYCGTVEQRGIC